jgi:hypothetical protein
MARSGSGHFQDALTEVADTGKPENLPLVTIQVQMNRQATQRSRDELELRP